MTPANSDKWTKVDAYIAKLRDTYLKVVDTSDSSERKAVCQFMLDVIDNVEYDFHIGAWDGKDASLYLYTQLYSSINELADSAKFVKESLPHDEA